MIAVAVAILALAALRGSDEGFVVPHDTVPAPSGLSAQPPPEPDAPARIGTAVAPSGIVPSHPGGGSPRSLRTVERVSKAAPDLTSFARHPGRPPTFPLLI
jgi:hypothetical protein